MITASNDQNTSALIFHRRELRLRAGQREQIRGLDQTGLRLPQRSKQGCLQPEINPLNLADMAKGQILNQTLLDQANAEGGGSHGCISL